MRLWWERPSPHPPQGKRLTRATRLRVSLRAGHGLEKAIPSGPSLRPTRAPLEDPDWRPCRGTGTG
jgi:hypothetical protein